MVLVSFLIFPGCKESELLKQIASDYFPVDENYIWYYSINGDTIEVVGGEEYVIASRDAYLVRVGIQREFFYKEGKVLRLFLHRISVGDKEDTLFVWGLHLPEYLIVDDEWNESYKINETVFGDEVEFSVDIVGRVVETSENSCEIERNTRVSFASSMYGNEEDSVLSYEWYERNVGLKRAIVDGKEYNLISYTLYGE